MAGAEVAGAVLGLIAEHLADVIMEEAELLGGVRSEVTEFEKSLRSIRAFLIEAESMEDARADVKEWVRQVTVVAYDIEDVIDKFLLRVGPKQQRQPGLAGYFYRFARFTRQLRVLHQIGKEIKKIKNQIHEIGERKTMFSSTSIYHTVTTSESCETRRLTEAMYIEESDTVGIKKPKSELIEKLLKEESDLAVISVVGMGGLGKTTLVRKVYQNEIVQRSFTCLAWVTVSRSFSPTNLLKKMFKSFMTGRENVKDSGEQYCDKDIDNMDFANLVERLRAYLQNKRYVVVLDDVWTTDAWSHLKIVFPKNGLKSRIMITTRKNDVALFCSMTQENVHQMEPMLEKEAMALFCKKAFGGSCPDELKTPSKIILKICKGLPLAIVTMGGLLSTKIQSPTEWYKVIENLPEENDFTRFMKEVLWLSYKDLPPDIKFCLMYFGSYPEDYEVEASALTQEWFAEGFVKIDLADESLQKLVDRSLVEVVEYGYDGSIKLCKVHDLIHWLILQKMREENFITLATDGNNSNEVRRLSISSENAPSLNVPRLRTLRIFDGKNIPTFSSFRMLRVLNISRADIQVFPREIVKLYHLTYLNLSHTSIDNLPESIRKLRRLQTLRLENTNITELPAEILHLHAILHLLVCTEDVLKGVRMPTKLGKVKCLRELWMLRMDGGTEQAKELGYLTELRSLFITSVKRQDWNIICGSFSKMRHLKHLHILISSDEEEPFDIGFMSTLPPTLLSILFHGSIKMLPKLTGPFFSLVYLELQSSGLSEDPLKALQHLPMLGQLTLSNAFNGAEMSCGEDCYKRLEKFAIKYFAELRNVHIGKGAMPKLVVMEIEMCQSLRGVPFGLENLKALRKLLFFNMPGEFIHKVREKEGEEQAKVKHIPLVQHFLDDDRTCRVENLS